MMNNSSPKVSVIIPFYNRIFWCIEAIQSVLKQTFSDYEILLIDDGSEEKIQDFFDITIDKRIFYFRKNHNGVSSARNFGINHARGEYIAFLDSDDLFLPLKLEKQIKIMENNLEYGMSYSYAKTIDEEGRNLIPEWKGTLSGNIYPQLLFIQNSFITTPTVVVRSFVFKEIGLFDEKMSICEDLDLWRRIAMKYLVYQIPEFLVLIRNRTKDVFDLKKFEIARKNYYLKAFQEDKDLKKFKSKLFAELYIFYSFWRGKNVRQKYYQNWLLLKSILFYPFSSFFIIFRLHKKRNLLVIILHITPCWLKSFIKKGLLFCTPKLYKKIVDKLEK